MVPKIKKDSSTATAANKNAKVNGIVKKNKKLNNITKDSPAVKEKIEAVKSVPTGKHIVFDDDDKPVAAIKKKTPKKGPKENVKDIGKRWYEEVMSHHVRSHRIDNKNNFLVI